MRTRTTARFAAALFALAVGAAVVGAWSRRVQSSELETPAAAPIAVTRVLQAQPFTLEQGYTYAWRAERPEVRSGWLLVLATDPGLCVPSDEYERVLYVGSQTAERINTGRDSGRIVAVVPSEMGPDGELALDLAESPIFWGSPRAPEQVDAAILASELAEARRAGIAAFPRSSLSAARASGGAQLAFHERDDLVRHAARLVQVFAPPEAEFANGLLAPRVR